MPDIARDIFVRFPPSPTTAAATVVLWDSGPPGAGETVGFKGLRPTEEKAYTKRVSGTLQADQAWTLVVQQLMSDGATWVTVNTDASGNPGGMPVAANATLDFNVLVEGGGRRRVAAIITAGTPMVWLTSDQLCLSPQSSVGK